MRRPTSVELANAFLWLTVLAASVVLLWDWDRERSRLCRRLREAGSGVRAIVVRDTPPSLEPEPTVAVVPAAAGEELLR